MPNALSPTVLRRLLRYQGRLEGAQNAQQAVENVVRALSDQYTEAIRSACEDAQIEMPAPGVQAQVNVDFITGNVTVVPLALESGNGSIGSPIREPGL